MSDAVVVIGAGGHAKVVIATLEARGIQIAGIVDDNPELWGRQLLGFEITGPAKEAHNLGLLGILAIGSNRVRKRLADELSLEWATAIHPSAIVHPSVELGPGTVVFAGSTIQPNTVLGDHVIVNTGATIDHECRIDSFAHVAPGVSLAGTVSAGEGVLMGIGSSVVPGVTIGAWTVVGAGAAVVTDLGSNVTAAGVPARVINGGRSL